MSHQFATFVEVYLHNNPTADIYHKLSIYQHNHSEEIRRLDNYISDSMKRVVDNIFPPVSKAAPADIELITIFCEFTVMKMFKAAHIDEALNLLTKRTPNLLSNLMDVHIKALQLYSPTTVRNYVVNQIMGICDAGIAVEAEGSVTIKEYLEALNKYHPLWLLPIFLSSIRSRVGTSLGISVK